MSRNAADTSDADVDVPAVSAGPADVPVPVPAAVPSEEPGVCGAAICGVGPWVASLFTFDVWLTGVVAAVAGEVMAWAGVAGAEGTTVVLGDAGTVVVTTDWSTDSDGFEPPVPTGTVVVGAATTVALVAGAAVVGGAAGATVVAVVAAVP